MAVRASFERLGGLGQTSHNQAAVAIEMPKPGTEQEKICSENPHKQLKDPYIIYVDFESLIPKIEGPALDPSKSCTQQTARHEACGYSYMVVRSDGQTLPPQLYRGQNAAKHFLNALQAEGGQDKGGVRKPRANAHDARRPQKPRKRHRLSGLQQGTELK